MWLWVCSFSHRTARLIEMCVVICLFCKLASPQLTTFFIFYWKWLWELPYLLLWSHFPFPILLLKTVLRQWDLSCLGEECFPVGQCPFPVTAICCCMMWFSPVLSVHIKALGVFIVAVEDIESRAEVEKCPQFEAAAPTDWCHRISDLKCSSVVRWTQKDGVTFPAKDQKSPFMTFVSSSSVCLSPISHPYALTQAHCTAGWARLFFWFLFFL